MQSYTTFTHAGIIYVIASVLLGSVLGVDVIADELSLFTPFKCGDSSVCLEAEPSKSFEVRSQAQCVLECRRRKMSPESCVGVNYREQTGDGVRPMKVCEMFYSDVNITNCSNFTMSDTSCQYIQKGDIDGVMMCANLTGILLQQHFGGTTFFRRTWNEFKAGFGDVTGNYWIGNDQLHELTKDGKYKLRIDLQLNSNQQWVWVEYSTFVVDNESASYTLHVSGYSGTAEDGMSYSNGSPFSTTDHNNYPPLAFNCVTNVDYGNGAGFWYANCMDASINTPNGGRWGFAWYISTNKLSVSRMRMFLTC